MKEEKFMLVVWCQENDLVVANTWFENHPRRKWTWISPGDKYRNLIDYVLIQSRFRNAVLSAKTMPGADCGSDHNPVVCKVGEVGKINGKKSRGRQRPTYVDSLNTWANLEQHTRSQFMRSSCERQIWKTMTVNACSRHGT
ncbi:craniofacial development protein 2 [Elysia marginata]|uniref:Craniofacial development protein 2 n=1 Tax=Elysia marginata TaxID=1093978 RepID=A0AAV4IAY8_9GAST|nr:craniofacial development protein 2 [Elysia marginata]